MQIAEYFTKAMLSCLSFISFQGALEEFREEL